jgi:hypothetical protein
MPWIFLDFIHNHVNYIDGSDDEEEEEVMVVEEDDERD